MNHRHRRALLLTALIAFPHSPGSAHLTRIVIEKRTPIAPAKDGGPQFESISGHFEGAISPQDDHDAVITDIAGAGRDKDGRVHYSATFAIAAPVDPTKGSGVLFYDVPNRGNGKVAADEDGHVRVISGWQGDIPPAPGVQTATVPVAHARGGGPVRGLVMARFIDMPAGVTTLPLEGGIGRPVPRPRPVSLDTRRARLFRQASDDAAPQAVPSSDWAFADCTAAAFPGRPDPARLCLKAGFDPRFAYTLTYEGQDPLVLGMGLAATRDLVSFLRHSEVDDVGTRNPLAGAIHWAVASGSSQAGNFLKTFVNLGFNADEDDGIVFDAINPNIAARQLPLNIRFGVPGGAATLYELGSEGTLWWSRYDDRVRGRGATSLLDRCTVSATCPKVMETFGSAEFWGLRMAPALIGTDGKADVPLPDNVRRYYFPSVTHGGSWTGALSLEGDKPWPGAPQCVLPGNPNPSTQTMRALMKAMVAWAKTGTPPPPSRYPTIAAGDLVPANGRAMGWPAIPGKPVPDGKLNVFLDYDAGPDFHYADLSGVAVRQPPRIRQTIPSLVPRVDPDGNETAGVPSTQLLVPLGTYLGWNEMAAGYGKGAGCSFAGGFIPFARTKAERLAAGDPRPSLAERYGDHAGFVARMRAVAAERVRLGWLLPDDAAALIAQADASDVLKD